MSNVDQAKLVDACRRLVALVDDPQPGFATWHVLCGDTAEQIRKALGESPELAQLKAEHSSVRGFLRRIGEAIEMPDGYEDEVLVQNVVAFIRNSSGLGEKLLDERRQLKAEHAAMVALLRWSDGHARKVIHHDADCFTALDGHDRTTANSAVGLARSLGLLDQKGDR